MRFIILTTFPSMYESFLSSSIIARAIEKKLIEVKIVNIREYTLDKNHRTDTPPIGGGAGLIMKCQPIVDALKASSSPNSKKIIMSPRGKVFNQKMALSLSKESFDVSSSISSCCHLIINSSAESNSSFAF